MNELKKNLTCTDLKRISGYDRSLLQEVNDVFRGSGFFSADATTSMVAVSGLCRSLMTKQVSRTPFLSVCLF
jgi:predicted nucleic acid-binding Zn ribbon protein